MRIVIFIISIVLLKVAVAVYSAYRCLLLVCTMLLFAVTVALAGHSTCMAIFSELRMVDPNHNENNNNRNSHTISKSGSRGVFSISLLIAGLYYAVVRCYCCSCWSLDLYGNILSAPHGGSSYLPAPRVQS